MVLRRGARYKAACNVNRSSRNKGGREDSGWFRDNSCINLPHNKFDENVGVEIRPVGLLLAGLTPSLGKNAPPPPPPLQPPPPLLLSLGVSPPPPPPPPPVAQNPPTDSSIISVTSSRCCSNIKCTQSLAIFSNTTLDIVPNGPSAATTTGAHP